MQSAKPLNGGELRDLNRRYKAYRLARVAAGERAQPYGAWPARSSRWSAAPAGIAAGTWSRLPPFAATSEGAR
jgi:hypothetical protein